MKQIKKKKYIQFYYIWYGQKNVFFLKKAIEKNFFKSKCFYWIDAGFIRKKEIIKDLNGWPSEKRCIEDERVLINSIRKKKMTNEELKILKNLNSNNILFNKFMSEPNVGGGFFGGQPNYLLKFIKLYEETIKLFIKNSIFIGKDQNLFAYIAYLHQDLVKIIYSGDWHYFFFYLK